MTRITIEEKLRKEVEIVPIGLILKRAEAHVLRISDKNFSELRGLVKDKIKSFITFGKLKFYKNI